MLAVHAFDDVFFFPSWINKMEIHVPNTAALKFVCGKPDITMFAKQLTHTPLANKVPITIQRCLAPVYCAHACLLLLYNGKGSMQGQKQNNKGSLNLDKI